MPPPLLRRSSDLSDWDLVPVAEVWVDSAVDPRTVIATGELSEDIIPSLLTTVIDAARKGCGFLTVDLRAMVVTDSRLISDLRRRLAKSEEPTRIVVLPGDSALLGAQAGQCG